MSTSKNVVFDLESPFIEMVNQNAKRKRNEYLRSFKKRNRYHKVLNFFKKSIFVICCIYLGVIISYIWYIL